MTSFYLSFATSTAFLGGVFIDAENFEDAFLKVNALGINPGGECAGWGVDEVLPDLYPRGKLLSPADLEAIDGEPGVRLGDLPDREQIEDSAAGFVCQPCNPRAQ